MIIKINCKCGKEIKVDIKTVDVLREENRKLKEKIARLNAKIAALESMKVTPVSIKEWSSFKDVFGD